MSKTSPVITEKKPGHTAYIRQSQASSHRTVGSRKHGRQSEQQLQPPGDCWTPYEAPGLLVLYNTHHTQKEALTSQKFPMIKSPPFSHICFPLKTINIKKVLPAVLSPPHRLGSCLQGQGQGRIPNLPIPRPSVDAA